MMRPTARRALAAAALALLLAGCDSEGTGLGINLVPDEQVEQMGLEAWQKIKGETPASSNAAHRQRATEVSHRLLRAAGKDPGRWEVVVFQGDQVNAFALPGGKIGVFEGMFRVADTPDQLAAVIGHEIAHVEERHSAERVNTEATAQLGAQALGTVLGTAGLGSPETVAAVLGAGARYGITMPYGRNQELEADRLGLTTMARAGYDPRAAVTLWQKMARQGNGPPAFLSTHPAPEQRVRELEALLPEALALYNRR